MDEVHRLVYMRVELLRFTLSLFGTLRPPLQSTFVRSRWPLVLGTLCLEHLEQIHTSSGVVGHGSLHHHLRYFVRLQLCLVLSKSWHSNYMRATPLPRSDRISSRDVCCLFHPAFKLSSISCRTLEASFMLIMFHCSIIPRLRVPFTNYSTDSSWRVPTTPNEIHHPLKP